MEKLIYSDNKNLRVQLSVSKCNHFLKTFKNSYVVTIMLLLSIITDINGFQPEFVESISNISIAVGRDAIFTCHVRHLGGYRVGWLKADTKAIQAIHENVITHNPRVSVSHSDQNSWNLHIKSVTEEDRGGYMCQLNTDPMKSQIGYLDVVIPPDFVAEETSSDVIVAEGSSLKLTCRARGYPQPVVTWRREDGGDIILKDSSGSKTQAQSFRGEVLNLTKIVRAEMGSYLCIASNGVPPSVSKRISLGIHFHPVIQVPNQLVGAPLGTDVQIECHVEASPKSINYWIKDTGEMLVTSPKYTVQEWPKSPYETKITLNVLNFQKDDVGSYRCIAKNSLGEVDSSIRLYEIPGPQRKVAPVKITYGQDTDANDILKLKENKHFNKPAIENSDEFSDSIEVKEHPYLPFKTSHETETNRVSTQKPTTGDRHDTNVETIFETNKANTVGKINTGGGGGGGRSYTRKPPFQGKMEILGPVNNKDSTSTSQGIFLSLSYKSNLIMLVVLYLMLH